MFKWLSQLIKTTKYLFITTEIKYSVFFFLNVSW